MSQEFTVGDYLVFQVESGFGLLRILHIEGEGDSRVWHLRAFEDLFLDVESADSQLSDPATLAVKLPHIALTNRAFEATQVARMLNHPLDETLRSEVSAAVEAIEISDRSVRLMLGLR